MMKQLPVLEGELKVIDVAESAFLTILNKVHLNM